MCAVCDLVFMRGKKFQAGLASIGHKQSSHKSQCAGRDPCGRHPCELTYYTVAYMCQAQWCLMRRSAGGFAASAVGSLTASLLESTPSLTPGVVCTQTQD